MDPKHDEQLTGYLTAEETVRRSRLHARMQQGHRRRRSPESLRRDRERCRAKAAAMMPTLRKAAWATGATVDEARVYASADTYARHIAGGTVVDLRTRNTSRSRESHRGRAGHRRTTSTRAGPSSDSDGDEPGPSSGPPARRRVVVDDHYLVVAVLA